MFSFFFKDFSNYFNWNFSMFFFFFKEFFGCVHIDFLGPLTTETYSIQCSWFWFEKHFITQFRTEINQCSAFSTPTGNASIRPIKKRGIKPKPKRHGLWNRDSPGHSKRQLVSPTLSFTYLETYTYFAVYYAQLGFSAKLLLDVHSTPDL